MILNTFFQVSVSIFCVVATVFMIILFVWTVAFRAQLSKLIMKLEEVLETAKTTANETKNFVEKTIESLETFKKSIFTLEFVRRIVTETIELVKNNTKGAKNGKAK